MIYDLRWRIGECSGLVYRCCQRHSEDLCCDSEYTLKMEGVSEGFGATRKE